MNNFRVWFKKTISNKNTVTILCTLAAVLVLYVGYTMRIREATTPMEVPYAVKKISAGQLITNDMVGVVEVPARMLKGSVITNTAKIIGKYAAADTVIPEGSLFYSSSVAEKGDLPYSVTYDIPEGYVLVNFSLDMQTSYGNSIYPGNYVDIYLKAVNKDEEVDSGASDKIMVGKLLEDVKVLKVLDSSGKNVFDNLDENRTPAMMIFAVPEEYHILLRKATYVRAYSATLLPIPTNEGLKDKPGEVSIADEELQDWINRVTYWTETGSSQDDILTPEITE